MSGARQIDGASRRPRRSGPRPTRPDGGPAFCGLAMPRSFLEARESTTKWKPEVLGCTVPRQRSSPSVRVPPVEEKPMRTPPSHAASRDTRAERRVGARRIVALAACALLSSGALSLAAPPTNAPLHTQDLSLERIDPNEISMAVSNFGFLAFDLVTFGPGLEYPKGTGKTAMFASGLWLGAMVQGQPRVAVSEYQSEYLPGAF